MDMVIFIIERKKRGRRISTEKALYDKPRRRE